MKLLDTPIEYENAVKYSREKGSQENLQLKSLQEKTAIALTCSKFAKHLRYGIFDLVMSNIDT